MINLLAWIVLGTALGWLVGMLIRGDASREVLLNIVTGTAGAMLAGLLMPPLVGIDSTNLTLFNAQALILALFGSLVTLSIYNVFRHTPQL